MHSPKRLLQHYDDVPLIIAAPQRSGMMASPRSCSGNTRLGRSGVLNRVAPPSTKKVDGQDWVPTTRRGGRATHLQLLRSPAARDLGILESIQGAGIHAGLFLPSRPLRHLRRRQAVLLLGATFFAPPAIATAVCPKSVPKGPNLLGGGNLRPQMPQQPRQLLYGEIIQRPGGAWAWSEHGNNRDRALPR